MKILIVDDNIDICMLLQNILLSEEHQVEFCCSVSEFRAKLETLKPDLIITDMLMSGFDGRTLTKEVKNRPESKNIRVMLMSAHPDAAKISQDIGADDFLAKPFEIDDLVDKVEQILK